MIHIFRHLFRAPPSSSFDPANMREHVVCIENLEQRIAAAVSFNFPPTFSLVDVNTTSSTYNQPVSPGDYAGAVSGWYFGHAT